MSYGFGAITRPNCNCGTAWALFALSPGEDKTAVGWINLHLLLWKYAIYHLTTVSTEDASYSAHEVWQAAWAKFKAKAEAKEVALQHIVRRAHSRGDEPRDLSSNSVLLEPIGSFTEEGKLQWDEKITKKIEGYATPKK